MEENFDNFDMMGFHGIPDLGKPTRTEEYIENVIRYIRSVWDTEYGTIKTVHVYTTDESADYTDDKMCALVNETMESKGWMTTAPHFERFTKTSLDNTEARKPTIEEKIDLLNLKLDKMLEEENYERAAKLRDEIAELKKGNDVPW